MLHLPLTGEQDLEILELLNLRLGPPPPTLRGQSTFLLSTINIAMLFLFLLFVLSCTHRVVEPQHLELLVGQSETVSVRDCVCVSSPLLGGAG